MAVAAAGAIRHFLELDSVLGDDQAVDRERPLLPVDGQLETVLESFSTRLGASASRICSAVAGPPFQRICMSWCSSGLRGLRGAEGLAAISCYSMSQELGVLSRENFRTILQTNLKRPHRRTLEE